ncbi:hypothetical protein [Dictyobacter aurantiacus]|uniref:Uncharacterized protein n=1 Tax=Dictyobacter aurantiacus TaxID=1936993 RepID=A0A401ZBR5_9CHLR|nr:hypothetical protein [Dictyobacter aurantiacus]GCE04233.1 hypothetical protein KDAU_15620 [Dictyobacter aurantiacus]
MHKHREVLPPDYHMTIAEIERRFYPLSFFMSEDGRHIESLSAYSWSFEGRYSIPPAVGPRHTTDVVSFPTYADAVTFCHRKQEEVDMFLAWEKKAARCEVYPERNAWYAQEIEQLTGNLPVLYGTLFKAHAVVIDTNGTWYCEDAPALDEAMIHLYERVYAEKTSVSSTEPVSA